MENEKKIEIENFISLESGEILFILEEIECKSAKFVYTVEISLDEIPKPYWDNIIEGMGLDEMLSRNYFTQFYDFYEVVVKNGEEYLVEIDDELFELLREIFHDKILWKLETKKYDGYGSAFIDILLGKTA